MDGCEWIETEKKTILAHHLKAINNNIEQKPNQTHFFQSFILSFSDYVYFETSSTAPFQIRRIEELNKTPSGNVEAKVMCFYRRRDLPNPLVQLADKHQSKY